MLGLPITTSIARKRIAVALFGASFILCVVLAVRSSRAATQRVTIQRGVAQQRATLRERLVYGLQARIPSELAFIDTVVLKVRTGKLPERVVNQTFFWARDRASVAENGSQERPIIFFQPAMRAYAKRLKIEL